MIYRTRNDTKGQDYSAGRIIVTDEKLIFIKIFQ